MKFLVVEDDHTSRLLLQKLLSEYGVTELVENGQLGIEAFTQTLEHKEYYDVIFLDINMPVMTGQEMLTELRRIENHIGSGAHAGVKVVMVTAHNEPKNVMAAFREQCDAFLVKPMDKQGLKSCLEELGLIGDQVSA